MGRQVGIVDSLDFTQGINFFQRGFYYVTEKAVIPLAELVGVNMEKLKQLGQNRVDLSDRSLVKLTGPLSLSLPPAAIVQYVCLTVCSFSTGILVSGMLIPSQKKRDDSLTVRKVIAVVVGFLAGAAVWYLLGKTSLCQASVEFFPSGTTFLKTWYGTVSARLPQIPAS